MSVILFALTMAVVSAMETVLFVSAHRQGLIRHRLGDDDFRYGVMGSLVPVVMFVISAPFAFISPTATLLSWIVLAPLLGAGVNALARRRGVEVRRLYRDRGSS